MIKISQWIGRSEKLRILLVVTALFGGLSCGSDDDGGNGPSGFGAVRGTVALPFDLTLDFQPVADATVRLRGGDYDQTRVSDSVGAFLFTDVPAGSMMLSSEYGLCGNIDTATVHISKDETTTQNLTLRPSDPDNCIELPFAGAVRIAIDQSSNTAVLLYDTQTHLQPAVVTVDLATGEGKTVELTDVDEVFDLEIISSNLIVFNYQSGAEFGLRFFNIETMTQDGADVIYNSESASILHPGRLALDQQNFHVFVTHARRQGSVLLGSVYAISVDQRTIVDADIDPQDGNSAFDNDLVSGSVDWTYNVAFDPKAGIAGEILVGNRQGTHVTAIDWFRWGQYDRTAGLVAPTNDVRIIEMNPGAQGFSVVFWDFSRGRGVAASPFTPLLGYLSGNGAYSGEFTETNRDLRSGEHVLTIVGERQSFFTLVFDPARPFEEMKSAIEERDWVTLQTTARFETSHLVDPPLQTRAFGVNTKTGKLYVAYQNHPILEVFDLATFP